MFFRNRKRELALCALPRKSKDNGDQLVAAKFDTDHSCGNGSAGITGRYMSKTDSFGIDCAYKIDDSSTVYLAYGVTDEKIVGIGLETGFNLFGRSNVVDLVYSPPQDSAAVKVSVRQGLTKLSGYFGFDQFSTANVRNHRSRYELDTKLNDFESFKMAFDQTTKAAKIKINRRLDTKNRFEAEYSYMDSARKFVTLTLKHAYSKVHTFSVGANYGTRKYRLEWDCKTGNGPWTVTTSFGFNTAPYRGEWTLKRRFEF